MYQDGCIALLNPKLSTRYWWVLTFWMNLPSQFSLAFNNRKGRNSSFSKTLVCIYGTEHHCTWEENTVETLAELKYYSFALNMSDVSCYMNCVHKNWHNLRLVFDFAKSAETLVIKEWSCLKYYACALHLPILCHIMHMNLALESVCTHCMHYQLEETCPGISSYVQLLANFMHKLP